MAKIKNKPDFYDTYHNSIHLANPLDALMYNERYKDRAVENSGDNNYSKHTSTKRQRTGKIIRAKKRQD